MDRSRDVLSILFGWLVVGVPVGLALLAGTWVSINRLGFSRGTTYLVALAAWGAFVLWQWRRNQG